jgi:hypothetical protein
VCVLQIVLSGSGVQLVYYSKINVDALPGGKVAGGGADFKNERSCTSLPTVPSYSVQEYFFAWVNKTLRRCSWLTHCVTRREIPSSIADVVFGKFSSAQFVLSAFSSPRIHSASNTHEYQGISFGVKYGRRVEMTPLPS